MAELPNYDRYTRSTGWKHVRFVPDNSPRGRVVQVPELNEIQTVIHDNVSEITSVTLPNGAAIAGLEISISGLTASISAGKFYVNGNVHDIEAGSVTVDSWGAENVIGILVEEVIETEITDTSLTDPVTGALNQGLPGAYRVRYDTSFVVDDSDAYPIHVIRLGTPLVTKLRPELKLEETLAIRTVEESGSYLVDGLLTQPPIATTAGYVGRFSGDDLDDLAATVEMERELDEEDEDFRARIVEDTVILTVTGGKAYVNGYRIVKDYPTTLLLSKALSSKEVRGEQRVYTPPLSGLYQTQMYYGPLVPFDSTEGDEVQVHIELNLTVVSLNPSDTDELPELPGYTSFVGIVSNQITQDVVTWTLDTHFEYVDLVGGGLGIRWFDLATPGTTCPDGDYTIRAILNADLDVEEDVSIIGTDTLQLNGTFQGEATLLGQAIAYRSNGILNVDYRWYLPRIDTIYLTHQGEVKVHKGISAPTPVAFRAPNKTLGLSEAYLAGNADATSTLNTVTNLKLVRYTMEQIGQLIERMDRFEYNQALQNVRFKAIEGVPNGAQLQGIFTDSFKNFESLDSSNSLVEANPPSIDPITGFMSSAVTITDRAIEFDDANSSNFTFSPNDRFLMPDFTEEAVMQQLTATETHLVNPYAAISLSPDLELRPNFINQPIFGGDVTVMQPLRAQMLTIPEGFLGAGLTVPKNSINTTLRTPQEVLFPEGTITVFAQNETIQIYGTNFGSDTDNIGLTIDGHPVDLVPLPAENPGDPTTEGTTPYLTKDTVKANSVGEVHAEFEIPNDTVRAGLPVPVVLSNGTMTATNTFEAHHPVKLRFNITPFCAPGGTKDPLAQTFVFTTDKHGSGRLVTGVKLYFSERPSEAIPVTIELRESEAGIPTNPLTRKTLARADVTTSTNASVATTFTFDNPWYCFPDREYAIVVMSNSNEYAVYTATVGGEIIGSGLRLAKQADSGVMLSSSNGISWTTHPYSDLKYEIMGAKMDDGQVSVFRFDPETFDDGVTDLKLGAIFDIWNGNTINWEYSTDGFTTGLRTYPLSSDWTPTRLPSFTTNPVTIRATIRSTDPYAVPLIDYQSPSDFRILLGGVSYETNATYVSETQTINGVLEGIKVTCDEYIPNASCIVTIYYGVVGIGGVVASWVPLNQLETTLVQPSYLSYTYVLGEIYDSTPLSVGSGGTQTQIKLRIDIEGPNAFNVPRLKNLVALFSY